MTFRHSGDYGDFIYMMAILNAIGGEHRVFAVDRPGVTSPFTPRVPLLKPLVESQPYITEFTCSEEDADIDFVSFRRFHSNVTDLIAAQRTEMQMQLGKFIEATGESPWLYVTPDKSMSGHVIIAQSPRYENNKWNWKAVVEHYGERLLFIGLPEEHSEFCSKNGHVTHLRVKDFLEMAQSMAGASLTIANQSSPMAVAIGLGVDAIQIVCPTQPDCIYKRSNVQYSGDGAALLPNVSGSGELKIEPTLDIPEESCSTSLVPPGMWQFEGLPPCSHFSIQQLLVAQKERCSEREAKTKLFRANAMRVPSFFFGVTDDPMASFKTAYAAAFSPATKNASQATVSML